MKGSDLPAAGKQNPNKLIRSHLPAAEGARWRIQTLGGNT
jgi:hypothetical protein